MKIKRHRPPGCQQWQQTSTLAELCENNSSNVSWWVRQSWGQHLWSPHARTEHESPCGCFTTPYVFSASSCSKHWQNIKKVGNKLFLFLFCSCLIELQPGRARHHRCLQHLLVCVNFASVCLKWWRTNEKIYWIIHIQFSAESCMKPQTALGLILAYKTKQL